MHCNYKLAGACLPCGCSPAQRLFQNRGGGIDGNHMLCKAFLREEGGSRSETKGACVIDGVTSPSELLDCKVKLRGIYVCGDSSALQALACPNVTERVASTSGGGGLLCGERG